MRHLNLLPMFLCKLFTDLRGKQSDGIGAQFFVDLAPLGSDCRFVCSDLANLTQFRFG